MNIFIGWSGKYSQEMALALQAWLLDLFLEINTEFRVDVCSSAQPGRIWWNELNEMLNRATGGIWCLTQQSLSSDWLLFEAAQISARNKGFVFHYSLDIDPKEIPPPLGIFHTLKADREGTRILAQKLYEELPGEKKDYNYFQERFEYKWPALSAKLDHIYKEGANLGGDSELQRFEKTVQQNSNNNHKAREIASVIPDIKQNECFVIALCGSAAIGKSTFADRLAFTLNNERGYTVSILPTDAFAKTRAEKMRLHLQGYEQRSHDLEKLNQCVGELIAGKSVEYRPYQHENGKPGDPKLVQPTSILIVEGVYSFAPMNYHKIGWSSGSKKVRGCRVYLHAEPGKAQELKFAADVTKRNKSVEEAFAELSKNYDSYDKYIKKIYYDQTDYVFRVTRYWAYS
ncbi:MAG: TIR domain-containing protein [Deltaproteobacteria bacterium]|nr:MAG: TIR domain-containing protein [Deltaproteobacteria bacterium]